MLQSLRTFEGEPTELQKHILSTYFSLRIGIVVLGAALPLVLALGGHFYARLELQDSISAYYHATGYAGRNLRDWFVGILFVVGLFLYLYKGFSRLENYLLNFAGVFCVGIAVIPMCWPPRTQLACHAPINPHYFSAISFFLCIAAVSFFCAQDTLELIRDTDVPDPDARIEAYKLAYHLIAAAMVVSVALAWILNTVLKDSHAVFWAEVAGICSFSLYWFVKSLEMRRTAAEARAIAGNLTHSQGRLRDKRNLAPMQKQTSTGR